MYILYVTATVKQQQKNIEKFSLQFVWSTVMRNGTLRFSLHTTKKSPQGKCPPYYKSADFIRSKERRIERRKRRLEHMALYKHIN